MTPPKNTSPGSNRPLSFRYILFFALFWPATYRILIGLLAASLVAPLLFSPEMNLSAKAMLYFMVATIGFAMSASIGRTIAAFFHKRILG